MATGCCYSISKQAPTGFSLRDRRLSLRLASVNSPRESTSGCFLQSFVLIGHLLAALLWPPDNGLKPIAALAGPILDSQVSGWLAAVRCCELATNRTTATPWNGMTRCVFASLCIVRAFRRSHRRFLTNFSGFLPEITPFAA